MSELVKNAYQKFVDIQVAPCSKGGTCQMEGARAPSGIFIALVSRRPHRLAACVLGLLPVLQALGRMGWTWN